MPVVSLEKECERLFPELFNTRKLSKRPPVAVVSRECFAEFVFGSLSSGLAARGSVAGGPQEASAAMPKKTKTRAQCTGTHLYIYIFYIYLYLQPLSLPLSLCN